VALGIGMGAAALCFAGPALPWDALILEALPERLGRVFESLQSAVAAPWRQFAQMVTDVTQRRLRVQLERLAPADYLPQLQAPVLLQQDQAESAGWAAADDFLQRWVA
jgi:hypothetical protein